MSTEIQQARAYLAMLTANAPAGAFLDIRQRTGRGGLAQRFIPIEHPAAARTLVRLGRRSDLYLGVAPRVRRRGRREDLAPTAILWADCDSQQSLHVLVAFRPPPAVIVASGTGRHAYWPLTRPIEVGEVEHANRRLAAALWADPHCTDAARILRPPGTISFKHNPPRPVQLIRCRPIRYEPDRLLELLPPERAPAALQRELRRVAAGARNPAVDLPSDRHLNRDRSTDPLQQIAPAHYVRLLTGRTPGRDGKIACPFHGEDRTPSLHVYPTPEQGWTCFACRTPDGRPLGGDIYTLASMLWKIPTRGRGFPELRDRLDDLFRVDRSRWPVPPDRGLPLHDHAIER